MIPPTAPDGAPVLRAQLHQSARYMDATDPEGSWVNIARHAWAQLDPAQRAESIPTLVVGYLHRVLTEIERTTHPQTIDPDATTYLREGDETAAWDIIYGTPAYTDATVDRQLLLNLLCEVELLHHRLGMAGA